MYIKNLTVTCFCLVTLFFTTVSASTQFNLRSNQWELLSVPANASNATIGSLIGGALPAADYGETWTIFKFSKNAQDYVQPELSETLAQGDGFWMIQFTNDDITISTDSLPQGDTTQSTSCGSPSGCFASNLAVSTGGKSWSLVGAPYSSAVAVEEVRIASSDDDCDIGFDIAESVEAGYLARAPWVYNSTSGEYEPLDAKPSLNPWQGIFVQTGQQQSSTILLLLLPSTSANL